MDSTKTTKTKTTKTQTQKQNCDKKFCKLYTKKSMKWWGVLGKPKNKKTAQNATMKMCKLFFCNDGCKGTLLEKGKKFPKLNKLVKQEEIYGKKWIRDLRKDLFKNKTDILVDNVHDKMPAEITHNYKKKGAISICDHYIPNGSMKLIGEIL